MNGCMILGWEMSVRYQIKHFMKDKVYRLYIFNLPFSVTFDMLFSFMNSFGLTTSCIIHRDRMGVPTGQASISFICKDTAYHILALLRKKKYWGVWLDCVINKKHWKSNHFISEKDSYWRDMPLDKSFEYKKQTPIADSVLVMKGLDVRMKKKVLGAILKRYGEVEHILIKKKASSSFEYSIKFKESKSVYDLYDGYNEDTDLQIFLKYSGNDLNKINLHIGEADQPKTHPYLDKVGSLSMTFKEDRRDTDFSDKISSEDRGKGSKKEEEVLDRKESGEGIELIKQLQPSYKKEVRTDNTINYLFSPRPDDDAEDLSSMLMKMDLLED